MSAVLLKSCAAHPHHLTRGAAIPTEARLRAQPRFTGKGVTIAFLDSGFVRHPDLVQPNRRIAAYVDVTGAGPKRLGSEPDPMAWHGTQTACVAAGSGALSGGYYRGLASSARLVLVKVGHEGRVREEHLVAGLEWVIEHRRRLGIRIVSVSVGGDHVVPAAHSAIDRAAERAVQAGLVVVAAAGNGGCTEHFRVLPPANSPSVITVGGYSDENRLDPTALRMVCSSFGATGLLKPEIVAPAAFVPAPILLGTPLDSRAAALCELDATPDFGLLRAARRLGAAAGLPGSATDPAAVRLAVEAGLRADRIVASHYQHVEGTSFAAPIVASIVAQMLEADRKLTPADVKTILVGTATPIDGAPRGRQGFGAVDAQAAVLRALRGTSAGATPTIGPPRVDHGRLVFTYLDPKARAVAVSGDFNAWDRHGLRMTRRERGLWTAALPARSGTIAYKFIVDGRTWLADPLNVDAVPDGHGGFNSVAVLS